MRRRHDRPRPIVPGLGSDHPKMPCGSDLLSPDRQRSCPDVGRSFPSTDIDDRLVICVIQTAGYSHLPPWRRINLANLRWRYAGAARMDWSLPVMCLRHCVTWGRAGLCTSRATWWQSGQDFRPVAAFGKIFPSVAASANSTYATNLAPIAYSRSGRLHLTKT